MHQTWIPEVRPEVATSVAAANEIVFAAEVEEWLLTQPSHPVTWSPRGIGDIAVHNEVELAEHVQALSGEGSWGVVLRPHAERWAQCMRVDGGWIVEVNGIPGPECFARRVERTQQAQMPATSAERHVHNGGRLMAVYGQQDVVPTATGVADIMWSWVRGTLPAGYGFREI